MSAYVDVYRIETVGGVGAYSEGAVYAAAERLGISSDEVGYGRQHPSPYDEVWDAPIEADRPAPVERIKRHLTGSSEGSAASECVFGFCSREQADAWFRPEHRVAMVSSSRVLVRHYRVAPDAVVKGGHQCVFHRTRATLVGAVDPATLEALS